MRNFLTTLCTHLKREAIFLLLLFGLIIIAYGLQFPKMGFYWDDWETVHLARQNTLSAYLGYFQYDRPLLIWTEMLLVPVLGQNPVKWQIFALLMRWINTAAFYGLLKRLWPDQRWILRWMALLLAVYPGFTQQALAATYSRYILIATMLLFSCMLMLQAIHAPRHKILYTAGSIFLGILQVVSIEYFIGLELLRPLLIFLSLKRRQQSMRWTLRQTLFRWAPYVSILLVFLGYRSYLVQNVFPDGDPHPLIFLSQLTASPLRTILDLGIKLAQNTVFVTLSVWLSHLQPDALTVNRLKHLLPWMGGFGTSLFALWLIRRLHRSETDQASPAFLFQLLILGASAILVGLIPMLLLGRAPMIGKWSDRFTLPVMYGCVLLAVATVAWFTTNRLRQGLVWTMLVGLALTGHIQTTAAYAQDWQNFKSYFWQLAWRAPHLLPGTVIIAPDNPFTTMASYSSGFATDLVYGSGADLGQPEYWWMEAETFDISTFDRNSVTLFQLRNIRFLGDVSHSLMVTYLPGKGCVHVLDDFYEGAAILSDNPEIGTAMLPYASTQAIKADQTERYLPEKVFGPEPVHAWCYYFQKADLARQERDWSQVISLYQSAYAQGLYPKNITERLPLVEAYLHTGEWDNAYAETVADRERILFNNNAFCRIWQTLAIRASDPTLENNLAYQQRKVDVTQLLACDK